MSQIRIVKAKPAQADAVTYLDHLAAQNGHCVGFLPRCCYEQAVDLGRVRLLYENGQLGGYLINGPFKKQAKIYQICVAEELRRIEFGTALLDDFLIDAMDAKSLQISLWCAEDLEANAFWKALNFVFYGRRRKNRHKKRWQNRYILNLPEKELADAAELDRLQAVHNSPIARLLSRGSLPLGAAVLRAKKRQQSRKSPARPK